MIPAADIAAPLRRLALPLLAAHSDQASQFATIRRRELILAREVNSLQLSDLRRGRLLSANAKTSVSLDFPIGHTCIPTATCVRVCYASSPSAPAAWSKSLKKRLRNLRYVQLADADVAVDRLTVDFRRAQRRWATRGARLDFLRVNGTGDLFPELIPVINGFAERNRDVKVWVVTRRFQLAAQVAELPNIYLQLSLDATTPPEMTAMAEQIVATHSRAYLSFLRTAPTDDTGVASIVFNEKRTPGLPYNRVTDCPVDAGRLPLRNVRGVGGTACAQCRKCFSESVLVRQRLMRGSR